MKFEPETIGDRVLLHCKSKYRTQAKAAEALGVSCAHINAVIHGRKNPPQKILDDMGLVRVVSYIPKNSTLETERPQ